MKRAIAFLLCVLCVFSAFGQEADFITAIASLSDPAKLATLGKREANPRLKKIVYWLYIARQRGTATKTPSTRRSVITAFLAQRRPL